MSELDAELLVRIITQILDGNFNTKNFTIKDTVRLMRIKSDCEYILRKANLS